MTHPGHNPSSFGHCIPDWLLHETFAIQHNPGLQKQFQVRMVGPMSGELDYLPVCDGTKDAIGHGETLQEAASAARQALHDAREAWHRELGIPGGTQSSWYRVPHEPLMLHLAGVGTAPTMIHG